MAVAAAVLVLATVIWLQIRTGKFLQYLYFCRFPLLLALVLLALPFVATKTGAASLLKNLFALLPAGIFLGTWLALLTTWVVMITVEIVLRNAYLRFRVDPVTLPDWVRRLKPALFALLAVPCIWTMLSQSTARWTEPAGPAVWAMIQGMLAALACLVTAAVLHVLLLPLGTPGEDLLVPGIARLFERLRGQRTSGPRVPPGVSPAPGRFSFLDGYIDPGTRDVRPGHLVAFSFFLVTFAVYLYHWNWGRPPVPASLPAIGYLLLVLILAGWILPGLAFLLDRYRVPVLTLLILASFLASQVAGTDHYYKIQLLTAETTARKPLRGPSPAEAFQKDEAGEAVQRQYPIVVVAASGGGITASLWTAVVLTSLQEAAGPDFARSIRLISAVSGGSVGTMHFLDRFSGQGYPPPEELPRIVAAARTSSLGSAAWGLAYPDLWRAVPGFVLHPTLDRGEAMEAAWRKEMLHGGATLEQWRQKVNEGRLPPVVFNATEVETGSQFLFTPLAKTGAWRARFFSDAYPGTDIPITTAVRLSATFPWVSPITRACLEDCGREKILGIHLADGGYFDNFGVVTVVNWMRSLSPRQRDEMKSHRVLVLLIRAFSEPGDTQGASSRNSQGGNGWLYATAGPILTMYNVRNTSQNDRNTTELSLIKDLLKKELGGEIELVTFVLKEKSPLSWKLSEQEADRIRQGIQKNPDNLTSLEAVRQAFRNLVPAASPPPEHP